MSRLFVGTFLDHEDQEKLSILRDQNSHLDELWQRKTRWVRASKLHLTWLFLGNVQDELIPKVAQTLDKVLKDRRRVGSEKIALSFSKIEVWPAPRKPRMIVLSNNPTPIAVSSLARTIRTGLIPFYTEEAEQEENRDFRPHITLVRLDRRNEEQPKTYPNIAPKVDAGAIHNLKDLLPVELEIKNVCLIQSHLGKGSNDYEILEKFPIVN